MEKEMNNLTNLHQHFALFFFPCMSASLGRSAFRSVSEMGG